MSTLGPGGAAWDDLYAGDGSDTEPFDHLMLADALALTPGTVLDLGCGGGGNLIELAQRGWTVTGVDSSCKAIRSARISAHRAGVAARFHTADFTTWKPEGLYDLVINLFALPPRGPARASVLTVAQGSLSPGGLLVVGEWKVTDQSDSYVTLAELTAALPGLDIIRAESINADPDLGHREPPRAWPAVVLAARRPM